MAFILKLAKFRASILISVCIKENSKKDKKNGQNGSLIHCLAPNSELIFDLKKLPSSKSGCHHYRDSRALW